MMEVSERLKEIWRLADSIQTTAQKFLKSPPTKQTIIYEAGKIKREVDLLLQVKPDA